MPVFALFESGFRPFFLLAGLSALLNMGLWLCVFLRPEIWPADALPAVYWHAHEMLYGFAGAAIGGFLLTAVPNWTGCAPYRGLLLGLLVVTWLGGRIALLPFFHVPLLAGSIVDLAFYPILGLALAPPLLRARKFSNLPFLVFLLLLFAGNLCFHLGRSGVLDIGEHVGLGVAIDIILVMVILVGGRIVPAFTKSGLLKHGIQISLQSNPWIERVCIATILGMVIADMVTPLSRISGAFSLAAALALAARLSRWQGHRTLREPLLWVLHLGYAWLVIGLGLKAASLLLHTAFADRWIHALTVGAFTTMILGVMTRASLGHTGRPLVAPWPIAASYLLISLAAAIRVMGPSFLPLQYSMLITLSGGLWIAAFSVFVWIYAPILILPRHDGRPG
ncbi:MAG TPA: NnrS family protein [Rhizomicrobium sp.]|nr:NnrS family protein [Rhizomicrobium sp.]